MAKAKQTYIRLLFGKSEKDVTTSLAPDLLSFTYDDKETNEADEISIVLKDPKGKWAGTWKPDGGEVVKAYLSAGLIDGSRISSIYCGKFYVDSVSMSGSPRVFEIKAISIPLNKPIRRKLKTRAWEKVTLKEIAAKIAKEAGLKLLYDADEPISYDRQDQDRQSDLTFLSKLCEEAGLSVKVTDEQLAIFDQHAYESKPSVKKYTLGVSNILSWSFESQKSDTYKSCTVTYRDPKQKKKGSAASYDMDLQKTKTKNPAVMSYTYVDPLEEDSDQEYSLKRRAKSLEEAKRLAKAKLRKLNSRKVTGSLDIIGDPSIVAGVVVTLAGFASTLDGRYYVEQATHSVSGSGYVTSLQLRKINASY